RSRRAAGGDGLSFRLLPATLVLRSYADPGRGPSDERDTDVATKTEPVRALEAGDTRVRVAAARVVDAPVRPRPVGTRRQTAEHLQADDGAVARTALGVVAVAKVAAVLVKRGSKPHGPPAQGLATGFDRHTRRPAFRVPETDGRRGRARSRDREAEGGCRRAQPSDVG